MTLKYLFKEKYLCVLREWIVVKFYNDIRHFPIWCSFSIISQFGIDLGFTSFLFGAHVG